MIDISYTLTQTIANVNYLVDDFYRLIIL